MVVYLKMLLAIKNYFEFSENKTNFTNEIIAGFVTFLAMIYIVIVNAKILGQTGMPESALVTSTVIIASFSSIAMGVYSKNPYAVAPAMGMNVFFTYTIVKAWGIAWPLALGAVFWSGVIFLLLAIFNVRTKILAGIPDAVKHGIGAGIGIFIALVGFYNAGFIEQSPSGLLQISPLTPQTLIFLICFFLLAILLSLRLKGAILLMIVIGCLLSSLYGWLQDGKMLLVIPHHFFSMPDFSLFNAIDWAHSFKISLLPAVFTFLFINVFDSTGTLIGLSRSRNWFDKEGQPRRMKESLLIDSFSSFLSGLVGTSPTGIFVESATGIHAGGRTGMVSIVVGLLFLPFLFLSPLIMMVPSFVVAPALVMVGSFMMSSITFINWSDELEAIPAFMTIILMPLTLSISEGIVWGMLSWFVMALVKDRKSLNVMSNIITFCCFLILLSSLHII